MVVVFEAIGIFLFISFLFEIIKLFIKIGVKMLLGGLAAITIFSILYFFIQIVPTFIHGFFA